MPTLLLYSVNSSFIVAGLKCPPNLCDFTCRTCKDFREQLIRMLILKAANFDQMFFVSVKGT